jgi:pyridoxine/pyridoxamine 5'-phosphate oxidase
MVWRSSWVYWWTQFILFSNCYKVIHRFNEIVLLVCCRNGIPSNRFLLMKGFDENGFKFYTNYDSRKGKDLVSWWNSIIENWLSIDF